MKNRIITLCFNIFIVFLLGLGLTFTLPPTVLGQQCNPGDFDTVCTGSCGGCACDAGEAEVWQCDEFGDWQLTGSQCDASCIGACGSCSQPPPPPPPPPDPPPPQCIEGEFRFNQCIDCNISEPVCTHDSCEEFVCGGPQTDSGCSDWCDPGTPPPPPPPPPPGGEPPPPEPPPPPPPSTGCSSTFPFNGTSCTIHPPGSQCPDDYQWCDGGCCHFTGTTPPPPPPEPPPPPPSATNTISAPSQLTKTSATDPWPSASISGITEGSGQVFIKPGSNTQTGDCQVVNCNGWTSVCPAPTGNYSCSYTLPTVEVANTYTFALFDNILPPTQIFATKTTSYLITTTAPPPPLPPPPPGCGKACIYSEDPLCRAGNCLDGSQNCDTNVNCGFVSGCSTGDEVSCPAIPPPGGGGTFDVGVGPAGIPQLEALFINIVYAAVALGFIAMFSFLVWAGFKYLTSGGEPKALFAAHQTTTWALLGVVFLAIAWLVLQLLSAFTGINLTIFNIRTLFQ